MKCPVNTVDIIGKDFAINMEPNLSSLGHTNVAGQEIRYLHDQHQQQLKDTILHEILHAISYSCSINLKEQQVHNLAGSLLTVFWSNPKLAKWLTSKT